MSNVFDIKYFENELKKMKKNLKPIRKNDFYIEYMDTPARVEEYLNPNFYIKTYNIPVFRNGLYTWMSISPMEVQSMYLPIKRSIGKVATGGLGLGYFTSQAMAKDEVESIDIYEKHQEVVDIFTENFKDHKGFEKCKFIIGDLYDTLKGFAYDFYFHDIEGELYTQKEIGNIARIDGDNDIKRLHFWGMEKLLLDGYIEEIYEPDILPDDLRQYFYDYMTSDNFKLFRMCGEDQLLYEFLDNYEEDLLDRF